MPRRGRSSEKDPTFSSGTRCILQVTELIEVMLVSSMCIHLPLGWGLGLK